MNRLTYHPRWKNNAIHPWEVLQVAGKEERPEWNKEIWKKCHGSESKLYTAVYPAVYIIKCFGLGPYKFSQDRLVPSAFSCIYSIAFIGIYFLIMYFTYWRLLGSNKGSVLGVTENVKVVTNFLVVVTNQLMTVFTREEFTTIWNEIQDFDERCYRLGYPVNERKLHIVVWESIFVNALIFITINQTGMYAFAESWQHNAGYLLIYVGTSISVYKFSGLVYLLGSRFSQINTIALKNGADESGWNVPVIILPKVVEKLHNDLMTTSEKLDSLYSWPLFVWLGNLCVHSVSDVYFLIDWIVSSAMTDFKWPLIFCVQAWLLTFLSQLLLLHNVCHSTAEEANKMGYIFCNWRKTWLNRRDYNKLFPQTPLHLLNRELHFSAAGTFHVNLRSLFSIVALLTTYLILLLQL